MCRTFGIPDPDIPPPGMTALGGMWAPAGDKAPERRPGAVDRAIGEAESGPGYIYIYIHMYISKYVNINTYIHICIICIYIYVHVYTFAL